MSLRLYILKEKIPKIFTDKELYNIVDLVKESIGIQNFNKLKKIGLIFYNLCIFHTFWAHFYSKKAIYIGLDLMSLIHIPSRKHKFQPLILHLTNRDP